MKGSAAKVSGLKSAFGFGVGVVFWAFQDLPTSDVAGSLSPGV